MTGPASSGRLTLGPLLFNWTAEQRRDFYLRIADEAPIDVVCLGEVVCAKRAPFFDSYLPEVADRLERAGKSILFSTLALITGERELEALRDLADASPYLVEANDAAALAMLSGRPHAVGPFINTYNEDTLGFLAGRGARRIALPLELPSASLAVLGQAAAAAGVELEVHAFGRMPLAISARCYHARAHHLHKDGCQYVCGNDSDGLAVKTLDGDGFLAVNGTQTLSFKVANLAAELPELRRLGIASFRLLPHTVDMVAIAGVFRDVLDGRGEPEAAAARIAALVPFADCANGFYHACEGAALVRGRVGPGRCGYVPCG
jgi:collagenase-like PrtC family protease